MSSTKAPGNDDRLQLPLVLVPVSNGEFMPAAASRGDIRLAEEVLRRAAVAADRLSIDRRRFLQTAGGMAVLLGALNTAACSGGRPAPARSGSKPAPVRTGGSFHTPPPEDLPACEHALGSRGEFIVDVHTHHVMPRLPWRSTAPATLQLVMDMLPPDCTASNPLTCVDRSAYLHDVFLASDTTVALLSDLPSTGESTDPIPFADAEGTLQMVNGLTRGGSSRLLLQNVLAPNFGPLAASLEEMTRNAETGKVSAFKVYTAWGPHGRGVASTWNQPRDMVAVSRQFPRMQFVVYHAGWTPSHAEGPYNPVAPVGVDSLLKALDDYRVPPDSNVWADIASLWRVLLAQPDQAAHAIGKLLKRLGTRRLLWGTDSVWYGPPQTQIMAFRRARMTTSPGCLPDES